MSPLCVLMVEDSEPDARLLLRELKRGGFDPVHERVDTMDAVVAALATRPWDVVLCDWGLPGMHALSVLNLLKQRCLDLPFLIVSGIIDEAGAVDALRAGAHDFLVKGRLSRLCPAIERELREARLRADLRKMQQQLLLAERLASLSTVAGGVANEINNPLTSVLMNLELIRSKLVDAREEDERLIATGFADEIADMIADARSAGERIARTVRDLTLLLRADHRTVDVDIVAVLESSLAVASRQIEERARLERDFAPVPRIRGHETQLGQVFLNLLVNAAQAIPEGDPFNHRVRVATRLDTAGSVVIEISDTGSGIRREDLSRIFDPFFTTKPIGSATGLGLAIGRSIVTSLGGEIRVETELGKGSTFSVHLPTAAWLPLERPGTVLAACTNAPKARRGRVLVVAHEATLAGALRAMLSVAHDVTIETEAARALEHVRAGDRFDVILCDLTMQESGGIDLYEALAVDAPQQARRIVFMTSDASSCGARAFLDEVQNPRLEKPFGFEQILSVVDSWVR